MRKTITVKGKASGRETTLEVAPRELSMDLLSFLRSRSFPIASSCSGEGKCRKCVFNSNLLSCATKVEDFIGAKIEFDYL